MVTRETPAAKAEEALTPPKRGLETYVPKHTKNFPYQRRNGFSHRQANAAYCYPKKEKSHKIHLAHLKWIQYVSNKPSNKKQGKD